MENLDTIIEGIRAAFETKNRARDSIIEQSRGLTRNCANSIRAIHRQEWDNAKALLHTARTVLEQMRKQAEGYPDLYHAGYFQDAAKEYVEASLTYALVHGDVLPTPQELQTEDSTYLNGMAEAATELRRYILDIMRREHSEEAEHLLAKMDAIYDVLVTVDFPDQITGGLRHRTDNVRGVLERTRGDITTSIREQRLQSALERAETRTLPSAEA